MSKKFHECWLQPFCNLLAAIGRKRHPWALLYTPLPPQSLARSLAQLTKPRVFEGRVAIDVMPARRRHYLLWRRRVAEKMGLKVAPLFRQAITRMFTIPPK